MNKVSDTKRKKERNIDSIYLPVQSRDTRLYRPSRKQRQQQRGPSKHVHPPRTPTARDRISIAKQITMLKECDCCVNNAATECKCCVEDAAAPLGLEMLREQRTPPPSIYDSYAPSLTYSMHDNCTSRLGIYNIVLKLDIHSSDKAPLSRHRMSMNVEEGRIGH